jgi:TonB family protein
VQPPPFKAGQLVWVKSRPTADPSTRRILAIAVLGPSTFEAATPPGAALPVERVASPVTVKIEEAEFCCPDYVQLIVSAIQQTWQSNQGAAGTVTLRFRIARSGTIEDIQVVRPSGFAILDVAARRALQLARLPPLPTAFPKDSLMVSLDFQYALASSTGPASPPPAR